MASTTHGSITRRAALGSFLALPSLLAARTNSTPPMNPTTLAAADAQSVLNVMDFEALARAALPPAHFGYIATGADDDRTVRINHDAYSHWQIRARRLVDVSQLDTTVDVFGTRWSAPIYLSAVSSMGAFHPEADIAVARAAASRSTQVMLSTIASTGVEAVTQARGAPVWLQLCATDDWRVTEALVKRAEHAGCNAIALTIDNLPNRNNETLLRAMQADTRVCTQCHVNNSHDRIHRAPMFFGLDMSRVRELSPSNLDWQFLARLRKLVRVKLLVKGIVTAEDAELSLQHGVDGIVVSNHGGRSEETLRSTIECLPEIAAVVRGRVPIFLDGGIRRGTDIFKALALGATGVGIGRPQAWGLAAFGQSGVESVLDILTRELRGIMRQAGTPVLRAITDKHVIRSPLLRLDDASAD